MKTAMQLLFEEFESLSKASKDAGDTQTSGLIDFLCERKLVALEKEREQLLNAFRDNSWNKSFNQYYSETYNQNK
jgi:hypothetical protein